MNLNLGRQGEQYHWGASQGRQEKDGENNIHNKKNGSDLLIEIF